jgi:hypothetical protein
MRPLVERHPRSSNDGDGNRFWTNPPVPSPYPALVIWANRLCCRSSSTPEEARLDWLRSIGSRGPFWFISDEGDLDTAGENRRAETWMTEHACRVDSNNAGSARVSRFIAPLNATGSFQANGAVFNEEIELNGFQLSQSELKPGDGLYRVEVAALRQPPRTPFSCTYECRWY